MIANLPSTVSAQANSLCGVTIGRWEARILDVPGAADRANAIEVELSRAVAMRAEAVEEDRSK